MYNYYHSRQESKNNVSKDGSPTKPSTNSGSVYTTNHAGSKNNNYTVNKPKGGEGGCCSVM